MSGGRCKTSHFLRFQNPSKQVRMSFCVASVALCDILTCLIKRRKAFCATKRKTFARFFQKMPRCLEFFMARAALWTCPSSFCAPGWAL